MGGHDADSAFGSRRLGRGSTTNHSTAGGSFDICTPLCADQDVSLEQWKGERTDRLCSLPSTVGADQPVLCTIPSYSRIRLHISGRSEVPLQLRGSALHRTLKHQTHPLPATLAGLCRLRSTHVLLLLQPSAYLPPHLHFESVVRCPAGILVHEEAIDEDLGVAVGPVSRLLTVSGLEVEGRCGHPCAGIGDCRGLKNRRLRLEPGRSWR